jgi:hypothetical protein
MDSKAHHPPNPEALAAALAKHDPFWAPQLIAAGAILLDLSLPDQLTVGPTWLLPTDEAFAAATPDRDGADRDRQRRQHRLTRAALPLPA